MSISIHDSRFDLLSSLLLDLIDILRDRQGDTWSAIALIAANKSATIAIDDIGILLRVGDAPTLPMHIEIASSTDYSFECSGAVLQEIMFGRMSLERAVASGKVLIRAGFGDLLKIRKIVASVLLDVDTDVRLLNLWQRFSREWLV